MKSILLKLKTKRLASAHLPCINNDYLFNAILGLAAVIQKAVTFFKLISFTNAVICNSRIIKSKHMIYECGYLNSRILKSKRMIYEFGYL